MSTTTPASVQVSGAARPDAADARAETVAASAADAPGPRVLPLHPRLRGLMRVRAFALALVLGAGSAVVLGALLAPAPATAAAFALAAVLLAAVLLDAHARAAHARYLVVREADGLRVERGVIWRSIVFVPDARIQHTEVNQGPLDRRWGMARLSVYTAATHYGAIAAPGLHHADAVALRDALVGRGVTDVV